MIILNVPYISQFGNEIEKSFRNRGCGIACLCMILKYFNSEINYEDIIKYTKETNIFNEGQLWNHSGLISIAQEKHLHGYRINYSYINKSTTIVPYVLKIFLETKSLKSILFLLKTIFYTKKYGAINDIKRILSQQTPVISSMKPVYLKQEKDTHLVIIIGYKDDGFIIHDPHTYGPNSFVSYDEFQKEWTERCIIIFP